MASIIKLKRSLTPGSIPGSLQAGELAINIADKKLFSSNGSSVFSVSGDQYNLTSSSSAGGAAINLTVDNNSLSNDSIQFFGGTGISVTRNANTSITITNTGGVAASGLSSAVTIQLSGDLTGSATFQNAGDTATINATIAANSVALGTDTTGNYVATVAGSGGVLVSGSGSESATVTVSLADSISANTTGRAATATALASAVTIQLTGDVTGSATFTGSGNTASISTTIASNSVALGSDTTGNYVATVAGTTNQISVSGSGSETAAVTVGLATNVTIPNNLTVTSNTSIGGNLVVGGNLEVNGTLTYIDSTTVTIGDNMLKLANTNNSDTVDTGFYIRYDNSGLKYAGLVRDATDGSFHLFKDLATEPDQTINFAGATQATLDAVIDGGTY